MNRAGPLVRRGSSLDNPPKADTTFPHRVKAPVNSGSTDVNRPRLMADHSNDSLITTPRALREVVEHLRNSGRFAFDTEFVSEDTFEPVLGLLQVATRERLVAIDPLAVRDLSPLWDVLVDPSVEVVMHAAGEDLRICRLQSGRLPERVVDVQIAAGLVGFGYPISLGNLVQNTLKVTLAGGETRTDWRRRPLSPAQIRYALDDVRHLLDVADEMSNRLATLGRIAWAEDEFQDQLRSIEARDESERWRRLSGLHQLTRRGLEIARQIWEWRRNEARRSNRPLRHVMRDDLIVAIAKRQPSSRRDLEALRDFNRPHLLARSAEIVDLIAEAQKIPSDELPEYAERHEEGPGLSMVISLLAATLNRCCAQQRVATGLVGSNADLKELVRWHLASQPGIRAPKLAQGWRGEVCGQALIDVLSGRRALRIADPEADVPIVIDPIQDVPPSPHSTG